MIIREIEAKSILRKHARIDSWFISHCGLNLYRGCAHNCAYCDGRAEGYYVEGEFGEAVSVKTNAIEILRRELDPHRKRAPFKHSFVLLGGGVGDSYQPAEKKYELARQALELLYERGFPVHVLTKSTLVRRDLDILKKINRRARAIVSFSFSSASDEISRVVEPGVPAPSRRLETIEAIKNEGIACGAFLMPVIPFITDTAELMQESVSRMREAGVDFIIFGGMTLKEGRQKDHFMNALGKHSPEIAGKYQDIYKYSKWGEPVKEYTDSVNARFARIAVKHGIPMRIPPSLYSDFLDIGDRIVVILEHIDYLLKMRGENSSFGYGAYLFSQLSSPILQWQEDMPELKRIDQKIQAVIKEVIETGRSTYYEQLLGVSG